eukprot:CAMPEP_0172588068 /NCGR_PEP_ID=MMETSP1068-20121228/7025_1 /TAXON_ID=35684 /ORGANISM="Pseudopedinella elastica, Strain CCMP716" /LENGTH=132 /DNA_ID=CAMNT_0013383295 /DNA_START=833 /DNA_END=1231 /DNA_ORIENTATION=-
MALRLLSKLRAEDLARCREAACKIAAWYQEILLLEAEKKRVLLEEYERHKRVLMLINRKLHSERFQKADRLKLAALTFQRIWRGIVDRRRVADLRRKHENRFRCSNCGKTEPGGVYCKGCGRRKRKLQPALT